MEAVERLPRVMGGTGTVVVVDGTDADLRWATWRLAELEAHWSRFVPSSDVCHLVDAAGRWCPVHPDTIVLLATMVEAQAFDGFHPGAGRVLPGGPGGTPSVPFAPELDVVANAARLPPGCWIDPGSIGKGLAADLVTRGLVARGCRRAMVELGGDLAVAGDAGQPWPVQVEAVDDPARVVATFALDGGGVATSTVARAAGPLAGLHHVVRPDGEPVGPELLAVTAVAPTGWQAEAAATSALVVGLLESYRRLPSMGIEAVFQLAGGTVMVTPGLTVTHSSANDEGASR